MKGRRAILALKVVLWLAALAPGTWLVAGFFYDWLTANPIEKITHVTGMSALVLLLCTLAVTPIRRLTGWNPIVQLRRPMGLFAFFYAFAHFGVWAGLDMTFVWAWMLEDILERPYITIGFIGLVIMVPLAITSTKGWIRRLGKRWSVLHRSVYLATALGLVHYYMRLKAGYALVLTLAALFVVLMALRVPGWLEKRARKKARRSASSAPEPAS